MEFPCYGHVGILVGELRAQCHKLIACGFSDDVDRTLPGNYIEWRDFFISDEGTTPPTGPQVGELPEPAP